MIVVRHVRSSHRLPTRGYDMLREYAHYHIILFKFIENKQFMHHLCSLLCIKYVHLSTVYKDCLYVYSVADCLYMRAR